MLQQKIEITGASEARLAPAVRIAVCGEVSSGKSTVLNLLLRSRILPDNIGRKSRPVVVAGYRPEPGVEIERSDGRRETFDSTDVPEIFHDATRVRLWSDHEHLIGLEIVEVPLTKAEDLTEAQIELVRSCDVMIWVTIASQAWRLTEKTIIEQLGDARPEHALLAVTRADKLRNDDDRARLKKRIVRETVNYFDEWIFVNGARQRIGDASQSEDAWIATGGTMILSTLNSFADRIRAYRAAAERAEPEPERAPVEIVNLDRFRAPPEAPAPLDPTPAPQDAADAAEIEDVVDQPAADVPEVSCPLSGDGADEAAVEALRGMFADIAGVRAAGICAHANPGKIAGLIGDAAQVAAIGAFCQQSYQSLASAFGTDEAVGQVASFNLSMKGHRVLFQNVPATGLVFLLADATTMSPGIAQTVFGRIRKTLGVDD